MNVFCVDKMRSSEMLLQVAHIVTTVLQTIKVMEIRQGEMGGTCWTHMVDKNCRKASEIWA
jgi:hypothetical protein